MTDSDQAAQNPEPSPSSAPAQGRGHPLWHKLKALLALRTSSVRDDLEVLLESEAGA